MHFDMNFEIFFSFFQAFGQAVADYLVDKLGYATCGAIYMIPCSLFLKTSFDSPDSESPINITVTGTSIGGTAAAAATKQINAKVRRSF